MVLVDSRYLLAYKVEQVHQELKERKVKVVFDFVSGTANTGARGRCSPALV
jgi:hypothetical protein